MAARGAPADGSAFLSGPAVRLGAYGIALSRSACRQWAFLLLAGPYHIGNHGTDKTLTVPGSGVDEQPAGTQDMDWLAGMIHQLPLTVVITLAGTLGSAALPPLNGLVSEWQSYQGLFQGFRTGATSSAILIVLASATLG